MLSRPLALAAVLLVICSHALAQDPFASNIRPTKPLSPAEQLRTFHLPEGFEIQLFASEADIQKPMNMAFDARGRLWVSGSVEYPFAAKPSKGKDTIKVLEDTNGDGKADQIRTFADGLNIPIGLYPYRDGVIAYSIPDITFFRDTDGDGKADKRETLFGGLGTPWDVHGMQNAFRRGYDGWVYVCHGFSNVTTITGRDGSKIKLESGNTYRILPDGSRVEQMTWGQVNPFGMTFTENGDLFNADCHSKPLSLLLRGGYYSSFGKPHDGLGFIKDVMTHTHGSTAIAGSALCSGNTFPAEYRGCLFVGNVMTSRVHRNRLVYHGATAVAKAEADFLICDDPWFRPVDVQFGPDGALYIADFYNRIIGHYEVPLDHPGRDRRRGRIWRVISKGKKPSGKPANLQTATVAQLIAALDDPNLTVRMLVMDELSDRIGKAAIDPLRKALDDSPEPTVMVHSLWVLHRLDALKPERLIAATKHPQALVRIHAMRMLAETTGWNPALRDRAIAGLRDADAIAQRAAADALSRHVDPSVIRPLLTALQKVDPSDAHLRQMIRIALRNQLQADNALSGLQANKLSPAERDSLADIMLAVRTQEAGAYFIDFLQRNKVEKEKLVGYLSHAVKYLPSNRIEVAVKLARDKVPNEIDLQLELLTTIQTSLQQRGVRETATVRSWGETLAGRLLEKVDDASKSWGSVSGDNSWGLEKRNSADGKRGTLFLSSLPGGEQKTGVLRSKPFKIPPRLQFYICGHLGFPTATAKPVNFVQLRLADSGDVIAKQLAPRNDLAQHVDWKLDKHAGKQGYLEVVDGLALNAYAWIGVARFQPSVVSVPEISPQQVAHRQRSAAEIARQFRLDKLAPTLRELLLSEYADWSVRAAAGQALTAFHGDSTVSALAELIGESAVPAKLRTSICGLVVKPDTKATSELLSQIMRVVPTRLQSKIAHDLAGSRTGGEALLSLMERGHASARLLQEGGITQKLLAVKPTNIAARIKKLTALLPALKKELSDLIATRTKEHPKVSWSITRGRQLFTKHCATCHQVHGHGAVIGPQLDGIGNRGLERVVEDVLDPNRNVDANFHTTVYALTSGKVVVGLLRRQEGKTFIVADRSGKEFVVPQDDIEEQQKTKLSIMPDNVATQLPPDQFHDLIGYLLTLREAPPSPVTWMVTQLDTKFRSEGIAIADVNRDGKPDVLAGEFWYEAPNWKRHEITTPGDYGDGSRGYSNCFAAFADDVNKDGWPDYIVVGFPGAPCHWYENPRGKPGLWKKHVIWHSACNETPLYADLFGSGKRVLIMGWQPAGKANAGQMAWFDPGEDPTKPWRMHVISKPSEPGKVIPGTNRFSHGLGVGDMNDDGRNDVLCTAGWWEQPAKDTGRPWEFHPSTLGPACANMVITDVNGDQKPDIISSAAHGFGIWWHRQNKANDSEAKFSRIDLFPDLVSQTHALVLRDIDGDGVPDFVTGKRWWAHGPKGDPGSDQPAMLYWFQGVKEADKPLRFIPRVIHRESGVGTQFEVGDLNGDRLPDIAVSNKRGVFIFEQKRSERSK